MGTIIPPSHRQQKNILPQTILECKRNRDTASFSRQIWLHSKDLLDRFPCSSIIPMVRGCNPPFASMKFLYLHCILCIERFEGLLEVGSDQLGEVGRFHIWHSANGEFTDDFSGND